MSSKKSSGLRKQDPKENLEDFQYLMRYLTPVPDFHHQGRVFAYQNPETKTLTYLHMRHEMNIPMAHIYDLARLLNLDLVQVQGVWHFAADPSTTKRINLPGESS